MNKKPAKRRKTGKIGDLDSNGENSDQIQDFGLNSDQNGLKIDLKGDSPNENDQPPYRDSKGGTRCELGPNGEKIATNSGIFRLKNIKVTNCDFSNIAKENCNSDSKGELLLPKNLHINDSNCDSTNLAPENCNKIPDSDSNCDSTNLTIANCNKIPDSDSKIPDCDSNCDSTNLAMGNCNKIPDNDSKIPDCDLKRPNCDIKNNEEDSKIDSNYKGINNSIISDSNSELIDDVVILDNKEGEKKNKNDAFQVLMMSKGDALTKTPRKDVKRLRKKSTQSTEKSRREKYVNVFDKMKDKKK